MKEQENKPTNRVILSLLFTSNWEHVTRAFIKKMDESHPDSKTEIFYTQHSFPKGIENRDKKIFLEEDLESLKRLKKDGNQKPTVIIDGHCDESSHHTTSDIYYDVNDVEKKEGLRVSIYYPNLCKIVAPGLSQNSELGPQAQDCVINFTGCCSAASKSDDIRKSHAFKFTEQLWKWGKSKGEQQKLRPEVRGRLSEVTIDPFTGQKRTYSLARNENAEERRKTKAAVHKQAAAKWSFQIDEFDCMNIWDTYTQTLLYKFDLNQPKEKQEIYSLVSEYQAKIAQLRASLEKIFSSYSDSSEEVSPFKLVQDLQDEIANSPLLKKDKSKCFEELDKILPEIVFPYMKTVSELKRRIDNIKVPVEEKESLKWSPPYTDLDDIQNLIKNSDLTQQDSIKLQAALQEKRIEFQAFETRLEGYYEGLAKELDKLIPDITFNELRLHEDDETPKERDLDRAKPKLETFSRKINAYAENEHQVKLKALIASKEKHIENLYQKVEDRRVYKSKATDLKRKIIDQELYKKWSDFDFSSKESIQTIANYFSSRQNELKDCAQKVNDLLDEKDRPDYIKLIETETKALAELEALFNFGKQIYEEFLALEAHYKTLGRREGYFSEKTESIRSFLEPLRGAKSIEKFNEALFKKDHDVDMFKLRPFSKQSFTKNFVLALRAKTEAISKQPNDPIQNEEFGLNENGNFEENNESVPAQKNLREYWEEMTRVGFLIDGPRAEDTKELGKKIAQSDYSCQSLAEIVSDTSAWINNPFNNLSDRMPGIKAFWFEAAAQYCEAMLKENQDLGQKYEKRLEEMRQKISDLKNGKERFTSRSMREIEGLLSEENLLSTPRKLLLAQKIAHDYEADSAHNFYRKVSHYNFFGISTTQRAKQEEAISVKEFMNELKISTPLPGDWFVNHKSVSSITSKP